MPLFNGWNTNTKFLVYVFLIRLSFIMSWKTDCVDILFCLTNFFLHICWVCLFYTLSYNVLGGSALQSRQMGCKWRTCKRWLWSDLLSEKIITRSVLDTLSPYQFFVMWSSSSPASLLSVQQPWLENSYQHNFTQQQSFLSDVLLSPNLFQCAP